MPRPSDDTLLQRAIPQAINDRLSFADAYGGIGAEAEEARLAATQIRALLGKRLKNCTPAELETARLAFLYAEQWEHSLGDAQAGRAEKMAAFGTANAFRAVRLRRWGKTRLEVLIAQSASMVLTPGGGMVPEAEGQPPSVT